MCNSRGLQEDDDISSSSSTTTNDLKKIELKAIPSKLGRKGDPRMHKALQNRLNNPKMSLLNALEAGGFQFHEEDGVFIDADHTLLSQRKNQLSRRIRLFKQGQRKRNKAVRVVNMNLLLKDEYKDYVLGAERQSDKDITARNKRRRIENEETHEQKESNITMPFPALKQEQQQQQQQKQQPQLNIEQGQVSDPQPVSLHSFLNNLQSNEVCQYQGIVTGSASESAPGRSTTTTAQSTTSSNSSSLHDTQAEKFNRALYLYFYESCSMMKRCMYSAGFSIEEVQDSSTTHREFQKKIIETELMMLQLCQKNNNNNNNNNDNNIFPQTASNIDLMHQLSMKMPAKVGAFDQGEELIQNVTSYNDSRAAANHQGLFPVSTRFCLFFYFSIFNFLFYSKQCNNNNYYIMLTVYTTKCSHQCK